MFHWFEFLFFLWKNLPVFHFYPLSFQTRPAGVWSFHNLTLFLLFGNGASKNFYFWKKNKRSASVHSRFRSVKVFFYRPDGASFSPFFFNGNERKTWQWVPRFSFFFFFLLLQHSTFHFFIWLSLKRGLFFFFFLAGFVCYSTSSLANRFVYTSI